MRPVITPNHLVQFMQAYGDRWWTVSALANATQLPERHIMYLLNKLHKSHLLYRRIGERTRTTFYKVKTETTY